MSYTTVKELLEENAVEYPEGTIIEWDGRGRFIVGDSREDLKRINRKHNWREWFKANKESENEQTR